MEGSWQRWALYAGLALGIVLAGVTAFVLFCFNTSAGHRATADIIESLSSGRVKIEGLSGSLPNEITARHLEVRDAAGTWLIGEDISMRWHAFAAIGNHIAIDELKASRIRILRRNVRSGGATQTATVIDVKNANLPHIELAPSVLGHNAVLSAQGGIHYVSRHDVAANLTIRRLDAPGRYEAHAAIENDVMQGSILAYEEGSGLLGGLVGMPNLGPSNLELHSIAQAKKSTIRLKFSADLLNVFAGGSIDLAKEEADIDFSAVAPDMQPSDYLSWSTLSIRGHLHGAFSAPFIDANASIYGVNVRGAKAVLVTAEIHGVDGKANAVLGVNGLVLPGEKEDVFGAKPFKLTAKIDLAETGRPVAFVLDHPLIHINGRSTTKPPLDGNVHAALPSLGGLARALGTNIAGDAVFDVTFQQDSSGIGLNAKGGIAAQGDSLTAKLIGNGKLEAKAHVGGQVDIALQGALKAKALRIEIAGSQKIGQQAFTGEISLADLNRLTPSLNGSANLKGNLIGPAGNAKLTIDGTANVAPKGMARQAVSLSAEASGLPNLRSAALRLSGHFAGAPVIIKSNISRTSLNSFNVDIADISWRSLKAKGAVTVTGGVPQGGLHVAIARLADLSSISGIALTGSIDVKTDFRSDTAVIHAKGLNIRTGETAIEQLDLSGTVAKPFTTPVFSLMLKAQKVESAGLAGAVQIGVNGPLSTLIASIESDLKTSNGQSFTLSAEASEDLVNRHASVPKFSAVWRDQTITLEKPASIEFKSGIKFGAAFIEGKAARIDIAGYIPSDSHQSMDIRADGTADLAVIGSGFSSVGQTMRGKLVGNLHVTGNSSKPNVQGIVTLSGGQIQDYTRGLNLSEIEATAEASGSVIRLSKFVAKAGSGSITGSGTIDVSAPGMPVNIAFKGDNARPVTSDIFTATMDSDLKLEGKIKEDLRLSGQVRIGEGTINIPEKFPREVATLNVRHSNVPYQPSPPAPSSKIELDVTVVSPGQIFVRGRGLEAEFQGALKIAGTVGFPQVNGGLTLRRGTFSIAGTTLTFQSGRISFNGQALRNRLDPSLDLVAQSQGNGVTATLKISGTASQPKIELSSSPQLPQDEILSQLLFQQSAKSLSATQLASVAQAAASLSGGNGFDPVGIMRKSLGLDRLAVGSSQETAGGTSSTTIEAGKYVLRNVYIGARQDLSGGTRALVQVDILRNLKAQAQVNTGSHAATNTSTPLQDNGDSIGLSYQFEY